MYSPDKCPGLPVLNRDQIKYIAVFAMTLNHLAQVLLTPEHPLYELFVDIGYVTAMTMCYFLVEGYHHTRSVGKYALRLLLTAVLAQPVYITAFGYRQLNMLFTVLAGLGILYIMEHVRPAPLMKLLVLSVVLMTSFCDWPLFFAAGVYYLEKYRGRKKAQACVFGGIGILFALVNAMSFLEQPGTSLLAALFRGLLSSLGIYAAAVLVLVMYSGKPSTRFPWFHKWFFYLYYPLHLAALCLLRAYT